MAEQRTASRRWKARPLAAATLRIVILLVPAAAAVGVTAVLRPHVPFPPTAPGRLAWWVGFLGLGVATAMLVERAGRRLLPLVMMLKLSMLFPDRAPSRYAVAREAGNGRQLTGRPAGAGGGEGEGRQEAWAAPGEPCLGL